MRGANRTGRPFTGDFAGEVLYPALRRHGFARGSYGAAPGSTTASSWSTAGSPMRSAVCRRRTGRRRPRSATCRQFLVRELTGPRRAARHPGARAGSPTNRLCARSAYRCAAIRSRMARGTRCRPARLLVSSFHTSRYNVNTGRLTEAMFDCGGGSGSLPCSPRADRAAAAHDLVGEVRERGRAPGRGSRRARAAARGGPPGTARAVPRGRRRTAASRAVGHDPLLRPPGRPASESAIASR